MLSVDNLNQVKAKSLNAEINKIQGELFEANLATELKYRKNNSGPRDGYEFGYGRGYHR